jgi:hypothetical protein
MSNPELPNLPLVEEANKLLQVPSNRQKIRDMHEQQYPLAKMVDDLGLAPEMSEGIRQILDGLSPEVVEGIRTATLDMLNSADPKKEMPLNCRVTVGVIDSDSPVVVEVVPEAGVPTIHVRPAEIGNGG